MGVCDRWRKATGGRVGRQEASCLPADDLHCLPATATLQKAGRHNSNRLHRGHSPRCFGSTAEGASAGAALRCHSKLVPTRDMLLTVK